MKLFIFLFAVFTAVRAEFDAQTAYAFADTNGDEIIDDDEFDAYAAAVAYYQKPEAVLSFTGNIPVAKFREVLESHADPTDEFSVDDAVAFADSNDDSVIDGNEFGRYYSTVKQFKEMRGEPMKEMVSLIYDFTGEISAVTFAIHLQKQADASPVPIDSGFDVEDAVKYADQDNDCTISADEFNTWYGGVVHWRNGHLKPQMAGEDGIISKEEFIGVLTFIQDTFY